MYNIGDTIALCDTTAQAISQGSVSLCNLATAGLDKQNATANRGQGCTMKDTSPERWLSHKSIALCICEA